MKYIFSIVISTILISACNPKPKEKSEIRQLVTHVDYNHNRLDTLNTEIDLGVDSLIASYRTTMNESMEIVIGHMPKTISKSRPNSLLSNWFTDILEEQAKAIYKDKEIAFALQNYGGLRIPSIPKGDITIGKIFELMPFDNMFELLQMDGKMVQVLIDHMVESNGWPVSNNIRVVKGKNGKTEISIGGKPLDLTKTYYVAMPDYIANGGGDCHFLTDVPRENSGKFIREVVIEYLKNNQDKPQIIREDKRFIL